MRHRRKNEWTFEGKLKSVGYSEIESRGHRERDPLSMKSGLCQVEWYRADKSLFASQVVLLETLFTSFFHWGLYERIKKGGYYYEKENTGAFIERCRGCCHDGRLRIRRKGDGGT